MSDAGPRRRGLLDRLVESRRAILGATVLGMFALVALFADLIACDGPLVRSTSNGIEVFPGVDLVESADDEGSHDSSFALRSLHAYGPNLTTRHPLAAPNATHPFGTDQEGRDIFARLVHGARAALGAGVVVAILGALLGGLAGALASQLSRRIGQGLERVAQAVDAFPALIVVAMFRAIDDRSSTASVIIGATVVQWATVARLVRTEVQRLSAEDYVLAARALGASRTRILLRHLVPHLAPGLISSAALGLSAVVMLEATLSFLGLGPAIAGASWGEMLAEGARNTGHGPLFFWPALLLSLTVGSAYLVAEGARAAFDPVAKRAAVTSATARSSTRGIS